MTDAGLFHQGAIGSDLQIRNLADVSWTHHLRNQSMPVVQQKPATQGWM